MTDILIDRSYSTAGQLTQYPSNPAPTTSSSPHSNTQGNVLLAWYDRRSDANNMDYQQFAQYIDVWIGRPIGFTNGDVWVSEVH